MKIKHIYISFIGVSDEVYKLSSLSEILIFYNYLLTIFICMYITIYKHYLWADCMYGTHNLLNI